MGSCFLVCNAMYFDGFVRFENKCYSSLNSFYTRSLPLHSSSWQVNEYSLCLCNAGNAMFFDSFVIFRNKFYSSFDSWSRVHWDSIILFFVDLEKFCDK